MNWKELANYDGTYSISELAEVRHNRIGRIISPINGTVPLKVNLRSYRESIPELMLQTFFGKHSHVQYWPKDGNYTNWVLHNIGWRDCTFPHLIRVRFPKPQHKSYKPYIDRGWAILRSFDPAAGHTWKDIVDTKKYQVSDTGWVRSLRQLHNHTIRILTPGCSRGYDIVCLSGYKGKVRYAAKVHRLMLEAFVGIETNLDTSHKNSLRNDNRLSNLEYASRSANVLHKYEQQKTQERRSFSAIGLTPKPKLEPPYKKTEEEKFWDRVLMPTDTPCWIWIGAIQRLHADYGIFSASGKQIYAHRYSYILHDLGSIDNLCVRHTCGNTLCVNPAHLYTCVQGTWN